MKLKVNNVHKFYGTNEARIEVLKGINCEVLDGEICVLLGPSGSGKSTLLNIIGGLEIFLKYEVGHWSYCRILKTKHKALRFLLCL